MKTLLPLLALLPIVAQGESFIVENGQPRAEIVIAADPPRSTRLAARELQTYVEKISGAKLAIVSEPTGKVGVKLYVGESTHTRQLELSTEGLEHGAYRLVSGSDWMAFLGDDTDFVPKEPWARNHRDRTSGKLQAEWEKLTGEPFGVPNGGLYKNRALMPAALAKEDREYLWGFDERGSYNAVCGFLRDLGVRWYLPGELGEVVPDMATIALPKIDRTVLPDFEFRQFNVRFGTSDDEVMKWAMRLGIRNSSGLMIAHGMHNMTEPEVIKAKHPNWFAMFGGKRDTQLGVRLNHLCYSNEELFQATVRWARSQFDVYDFESVSIMPPDAYIAICQCPLCEGKDEPDRGSRGKLSNHVWDFVNRVAKEVGKTHPDKLIVCCAYGANTDPPTNIEKLEPNVQVIIVGGRRPRNSLPEQREEIRGLQAGWRAKTDNQIMIFENYPFTGRGMYLPAFVARSIGESINETKGVSRGEDIWLSFPRFYNDPNIGFDHFQVYFTARMWWGGKEADVVAMLEEYCRLFYGAAGPEMEAFFNFCEANYQAMEKEKEKVDTALAMFAAAKAKVQPDSIYSKRLGLIDDFLNALRSKAEQLGQKRGPVAKLRTVWEPNEPIVIDGKLDDQYWRECPTSSTGRLRDLQTGTQPIFGTSIMSGWNRGGQNLYFAIRCDENPGEALNVATTENEDQSMWYGDAIEIELQTDSHSYYQIAINPSGALIDLDRGAQRNAWFRWQSQAEVATHVAEDHWIVEIRIPVTEDENDPLNQVVGRKPSASLPWHFNICRQRIRETGAEHSAFSPTGTAGYHVPMKFAHFYDGRSHAFEVDETLTDFLIEASAAAGLMQGRKYEEALTAFIALGEHEEATDLQKSRVLANAANCARVLKDYDRAAELAELIPLEPIAKAVEMENLLAQGDWNAVIQRFGGEDFALWPFTQVGSAAWARGRAYYGAKIGDKADADLQLALKFTSDTRIRMSILRTIGNNRETVLKDDDLALETYRQIAETTTNAGSAEFFYGLQGAARILTKRGEFDEAMKILDLVEAEKLSGSWAGSMLLSRGQTLAAAGRSADARLALQAVLANENSADAHKNIAEEALKSLGDAGRKDRD